MIKLKATLELIISFVCIPAIAVGQVAIAFPFIFYQYCRIRYLSSVFFKVALDKTWVFMENSKSLFWLPPLLSGINKLTGATAFESKTEPKKVTAKTG